MWRSNRSLTTRQREILQQYADDVEGRTTGDDKSKTPSAGAADEPKETADRRPNSKADDNGTVHFSSPQPPSQDGGWAEQSWKKIRGLIGF
jgi:molecular chaperone DnaJ